jgi:hypothetical protein
MLLLAFTLYALLLLSGFTLSFLLLVILSVVMAHIKSITVPRQPDDNVDLEVADASAWEDVAGASSAFDQVTRESEAIGGREDHENSETEAEEDDNMDDPKTIEGGDADFEAEARGKLRKAVAAAALTFEFGPLTITKGSHLRNGEAQLFFFRKVMAGLVGKRCIVSEPSEINPLDLKTILLPCSACLCTRLWLR